MQQGNKKTILIWSGVILGGLVVGAILYRATTGKRNRIAALAKEDKEMEELLKRIDSAPK
jgi:hypothetical protein